MDTLLLSERDVASVIDLRRAIAAMEEAFACHGRGATAMPLKVHLPVDPFDGEFRAMPAYLEGAAGVKWSSSHPNNPARHRLPAVMGLIILNDPSTAAPLAVMDATLVTAVRTGVAAVIATKRLGREDAETVGIIGCGVQAYWLLKTHLEVFGRTHEILMADIDRMAAERLADEGGEPVSIEEAAHCDIVYTTTPSTIPIVEGSWIRPGTHISAIGANAPGKQELDPTIVRDARVFVDDLEHATINGEVNLPIAQGQIRPSDIAGTLGEVISSRVVGRRAAQEITLFDSSGLAIQDVALARMVFEAARDRGIGGHFRFLGF